MWMDVATARMALHAWQLQPRSVRREVLALSRKGLPAPDPAIAKLAVDWGRSEYPLLTTARHHMAASTAP